MTLKTILALPALFFAVAAFAQTDPPKEKVYELFDVQKAPSFPGGDLAMMRYVADNIRYPDLAREKMIQGMVALTFDIETDGSVSNVNIVKEIGGGCGAEAIRVVKSMPKWAPGEVDGHPVKVRYTLPVRFVLDDVVRTPASTKPSGPLDRTSMWNLVSTNYRMVYGPTAQISTETPFKYDNPEATKIRQLLEEAVKIKFAEGDIRDFQSLEVLSEYCYKAQFAPMFFTKAGYTGKSVKILTHRKDFDTNADGPGSIGSLLVPKGIEVTLYSKKNFKGKKLKINAKTDSVEISDLSSVEDRKGKIKNTGKGINWGTNTQSVKINLPSPFPQ